jgi:hypothetical protein
MIRVVPKGKIKAPLTYSVGVRINGNDMSLLASNENPPVPGECDTLIYKVFPYLKGDVNKDNLIDIEDIVSLINYTFYEGIAPEPIDLGDVNCDQGVNIGDIVYLIEFVFYQSTPPCS